MKSVTIQGRWTIVAALVAGLLVAVAAAAVRVQPPLFQVDWWTANSGGVGSSGEDFDLIGVAGQPDACVSSGGDFVVEGGFLNEVTAAVPVDLVQFTVE